MARRETPANGKGTKSRTHGQQKQMTQKKRKSKTWVNRNASDWSRTAE